MSLSARPSAVPEEYLDDYCSRDLARFTPEAEAWAGKVREMEDFFEARGKIFLYVITPSKPAIYPERYRRG